MTEADSKELNLIKIRKSEKVIGKIPPKSIELEMAVLGALMLEKDSLTSIIDILSPGSFYKDAHQEIYKAIIQLFNQSEPIDILTVTSQLKKNNKLEQCGGPQYVAFLTNNVGSTANIETHARLVLEYSIRRELISFSSKLQNSAYEESNDVFDILDKGEQDLFDVGENLIRKGHSDIKSLVKEAYKELEFRRNQKEGLMGVPSGFIDLDSLTQGWQKSDMVIIAARPGMGKTAFVLSAARNAAVDHNYPVAIFSLEMSGVQLMNRLISSEAELESDKIRRGNLAEHEWQQLMYRTDKLSEAPIYVDDTPALSIFELRAKCRRLKAKHDIQLIIIDYLQLMSGSTNTKQLSGNREQEIASISRALKCLAKELNVPVIALSQLSRAVETRGGDKKPQLSDLRESGSIEQDADMVMFLYRPEYYGLTEEEDGNSESGYTELIVAKHRNGELRNIGLKYISRFTRFTDLDRYHESGGNYMSKASKMNEYPSNTEDDDDAF